MKIVKSSNDNYVDFEKVPVGELFRTIEDNYDIVFMKIEDAKWNCVDLVNGRLYYLQNNARVLKVNGELVLEP